jgi:hypothetical protein
MRGRTFTTLAHAPEPSVIVEAYVRFCAGQNSAELDCLTTGNARSQSSRGLHIWFKTTALPRPYEPSLDVKAEPVL